LDLQEDAPLARKAYWRAGGPADALIEVSDLPALVAVQQVAADTGTPVFVLGAGSNVLIADRGVRGIVLRLGGTLAEVEVRPGPGAPELVVGAGSKNVALLARAQRNGWTGL